MAQLQSKKLEVPEETQTFPHAKANMAQFGDVFASRLELHPGWKWSESMKSASGTESCQFAHTGFMLSGRLHVLMDDGATAEFGTGDAYSIPPGHDAWVVGDEPVVMLDVGREY